MSSTLHIEHFDTDASSYKHRNQIRLKSAGAFRITEAKLLAAEALDGTTKLVPLVSIKEFYEQPSSDCHEHKWELDNRPVDEITEESCTCGARKQTVRSTDAQGTTTTITLFEPAKPDETELPPTEIAATAAHSSTEVLVEGLLQRVGQAGFDIPADLKTAPTEEKADFLLEVLVEAEISLQKQ